MARARLNLHLTRNPTMTVATLLNSAQTQPVVTLRDDERQRCEVWTRVMGYHRPVASFNIGKQGEFNERVAFVEPCGAADCR
jgi:hypothetical protein